MKTLLTDNDAKLLFVLLDAAEQEGCLTDSVEGRWRAAKRRSESVESGRYVEEADRMWALLEELDRSGSLDGSWIQRRWHKLKARVMDEAE